MSSDRVSVRVPQNNPFFKIHPKEQEIQTDSKVVPTKNVKEIHQTAKKSIPKGLDESVLVNDNMRGDFENILSNKDSKAIPQIKILKVIEEIEQQTTPPTKQATTIPTTNYPESPTIHMIQPSINLTALTPKYSLNKHDRRLKGLVFRKFRGSESLLWSVYSEVTEKRDSNEVTLIVIGENSIQYQDYIDNWKE